MAKATYIVVNRHRIRANAKAGQILQPPIRVSTGKFGKPRYGVAVEILGPSTIVYQCTDPILCGARLAIVTTSDVRLT